MQHPVRHALEQQKNPAKAKILAGFFKTGKGEYGFGDVFLGITVPEQRKIAQRFKDLSLQHVRKLLHSNVHEHRLTGFLILIEQFERGNSEEQKQIYRFVLKNRGTINNWDLVDTAAPSIIGAYLLGKDTKLLFTLAQSQNLWERRIAIIATYTFIKKNQFDLTLKIAAILLHDQHDLIHKAVGWMLREIGKRDLTTEEAFLNKHYHHMPRTMLRYAIERFDTKKKKFYMSGIPISY